MSFRVLGPIAIHTSGRWESPSGRLQQVLLGRLLTRAGSQVSADSLVEALWGEQGDDRAMNRLQVHVHRLRSRIDAPARLVREADGYRLDVGPDELDSLRFTELADRAQAAPRGDPQRIEHARAALSLWRGTAYGTVDDDECRREADRLAERRLVVSELLFEEEIGRGRQADVLPEIAAMAADHPLRESLQALHMRALHASGRQTEALEVYRRTRAVLVEEVGVDPSTTLQDLHERVLAGSLLEEGRARAVQVPAQLPAPPTLFTGRASELAHLDGVLLPGVGTTGVALRTCLVAGTAGVGKTALVLHWAHRNRESFPDGQLFADLRGFSPEGSARPEEVLDGFIRALGTDPGNLGTLEERTAEFRSLAAGRRLLVVLDNVRSADQARALLPGTPECTVVLTSRDALTGLVVRDGATRVVVHPLSEDQSSQLLGALLESGPDDLLAELAGRCAHLPLALRVAAERMRTEAGTFGSGAGGEAPLLEFLDADGDPDSDIRSVFSWSYEALAPQAATVFRAFGVLPERDTDWRNLAVLAELGERETRAALRALTRAHLVHKEDGRFSQHDLLREYAAGLVGSHPHDVLVAARERLLEHQVAMASRAVAAMGVDSYFPARVDPTSRVARDWQPGPEEAELWLLAELDNIVGTVERCGEHDEHDPDLVLELSERLRTYVRLSGHIASAIRLHTVAVATARRQQDSAALSRTLHAWAVAKHAGRTDEALAAMQEAASLAHTTHNRRAEFGVVNDLGSLLQDRGDMAEAITAYEEAFRLVQDHDPRSAVIASANVAVCCVETEQYAAARDALERCLAASGARDEDAVNGFARLCQAMFHVRLGEPDLARHALEASEELLHRQGLEAFLGDRLELRGELLLLEGQPVAAAAHFQQAADEAQRRSDLILLVSALRGLASARAESDPDEATERFAEAVGVARAAGAAAQEVLTRRVAAEHCLAHGDRGAAVRHLERAAELLHGTHDPRLPAVEERLDTLHAAAPQPALGR